MLTVERLKEVLHYNPETGVFTWRVRLSNRVNVGDIAKSRQVNDYLCARIDNKLYLLHRLAWLYVYGGWPKTEVDHINMDRADNRIANLREVTSGENKMNTGLRKNNTSGVRGVSWFGSRNKWVARATIGGRIHVIGYFTDIEDAKQAYLDKVLSSEVGEFLKLD